MRLYRSLDTYKQRTVNTLMESMIENDLLPSGTAVSMNFPTSGVKNCVLRRYRHAADRHL